MKLNMLSTKDMVLLGSLGFEQISSIWLDGCSWTKLARHNESYGCGAEFKL